MVNIIGEWNGEKIPETSLEEITETNPMQKEMNKGLMVMWINKMGAYHNDVRKSFVYYDADKDFVSASTIPLGGPGAENAFKILGIKYWSKGIV
jgi:hypothetical protein